MSYLVEILNLHFFSNNNLQPTLTALMLAVTIQSSLFAFPQEYNFNVTTYLYFGVDWRLDVNVGWRLQKILNLGIESQTCLF